MKVCFETFGCRLNRAEALEEEAKYIARGWEVTDSHADAHLIVVRGCSVTARAQHDCEKTIEHLKQKYPHTRILVTGCLPSADKTYKVRDISEPGGRGGPESSGGRGGPPATRTARAYLKVQDGCNGQCTFCIVPQFRGKSTSVPFQELLDKAKRFLDVGYHEIVLTGCNLTQYLSEGKRLPELLAAIADIGAGNATADDRRPTCRVRLGSVEPGPVALNIVNVMAEHANICRFLHIPVQSGSNLILKAMKRPYTVQDVEALADAALAKMPMLGLGCDLIAGFPGETQNDHMATLGLLKRLPFNNAHVFPFSSRPGTAAALLSGELARDLRHARAREIAYALQERRVRFAQRFMGKDVEIVLESEKDATGWTSEYLACEIVNKNRLTAKRKDLVRVHVTEVRDDRLKATFV